MKVIFSESERETLHIEIETDTVLSTEGYLETRTVITCRRKTTLEEPAERPREDSAGEGIGVQERENIQDVSAEDVSAIIHRISQQYSTTELIAPEESNQDGQEPQEK